MNNITPEMRKKWKEQSEFMFNIVLTLPDPIIGFSERKFIKNVYRLILSGKDLTFHQSTTLNNLCNKYQ